MVTLDELQRIADGILPGVEVSIATDMHPTYDEQGRRFVVDDQGATVVAEDPQDPRESVRHPVSVANLKAGRVTCSFDLVEGKGSPHTRTPRTREDVESIIRAQLANLVTERTTNPAEE